MNDTLLRQSFSRVKDDVAYLASLITGHGNSINELKILLRSQQYRIESLEAVDLSIELAKVSEKVDSVEKELLGTIKTIMKDVLIALQRLDKLEKRDVRQEFMVLSDEIKRVMEEIDYLKTGLDELKSESLGQVYDRISVLEQGDARVDMAQIHSRVEELSSQIGPLKDIAEHKVGEMSEFQAFKQRMDDLERRLDELHEARLKELGSVKDEVPSIETDADKTENASINDVKGSLRFETPVSEHMKNDETSVRLIKPDDEIKEKKIVLRQFSKSKKQLIQEKILAIVTENELSVPQLKEVVVDHNHLCSKASFYRYFDDLKAKGRVDVKKDNGDETVVVL